jgi:hypothetical protein
MSKQTPSKGRQGQTPPVRQENDLTSVRPSRSSLHGAATSKKAPEAHAPAARGSSPTDEQIAARAYQLWEEQGRRAGTDRNDWFEAERLLRAEAR